MRGLAQLVNRVHTLAVPFITPITGRGSDGAEYAIGTATYVEHRKRRFIVTAAHVAEKLVHGYELGVFSGQGFPPGRLLQDWWLSEADSKQTKRPWNEDVAVLDVTGFPDIDKAPLASSFLTSATNLSEQQGIFLCGYAKNPTDPEASIELELLQKQDYEAQELHVAPLTSSAPYLSNAQDLRPFEFGVYFSARDNKATDGREIDAVFSAKGWSGSAVWRVRNSPPSPADVKLEGLEVIGIATRWPEDQSMVQVTKIEEVIKVLDACVDAHLAASETNEAPSAEEGV